MKETNSGIYFSIFQKFCVLCAELKPEITLQMCRKATASMVKCDCEYIEKIKKIKKNAMKSDLLLPLTFVVLVCINIFDPNCYTFTDTFFSSSFFILLLKCVGFYRYFCASSHQYYGHMLAQFRDNIFCVSFMFSIQSFFPFLFILFFFPVSFSLLLIQIRFVLL